MGKVYRTDKGKVCTKCKEFKLWPDFPMSLTKMDMHTYQCRECGNKRGRAYFQKNKARVLLSRNLKARNPQKDKTRSITRNAVKAGKIPKLPCQKCGDVVVQAHHPDYSDPFNIIWLCRKHHMELHRKATGDKYYAKRRSRETVSTPA